MKFINRTLGKPILKDRKLLISVAFVAMISLTGCGSSDSDSIDPEEDSPLVGGGNSGTDNNTGNGSGSDTAATGSDTGSNTGGDTGSDTAGTGSNTGSDTGSDTAGIDAGSDTGTDAGNTTGENGNTSGSTEGGKPVSSEITPDRVLTPLPSRPLTPAPGPDSEPVRAQGPVTTVTEFFVVQDPARDLDDNFGVLTDEDYAAGPLPAVTHIPEHVDTSVNSLPYFIDLHDVEVFAGEEVEILLRPLDDDGGIPGLFPNGIPPGARYVDNFNGTRSLIWRPLQPQVGITEFTITATDPVEPYYRTERTIRIKVKMPSDTSGIVNLAPVVNEIRPPTVRVNDPVVIYIKVSDPNGTIPTLTIANPPPGSTQVPHYSDPATTVLKFTPRTAETIALNLTAHDAEDFNLTRSRTVNIEVLEEDDFIRPGSRLKDLATSRGLLFGYAALQNFYEHPDGAIYADIAAEEFNFVSTENSLKWDLLNPLPGKFRWAQSDNLVKFAKANRQTLHGHTLVWHRQLPNWIKRSALADREGHMREFIDRVLTRYGSDMPIWDVVNEALEEDGTFRNSTWYEAMGADFIDIAFRQAKLSAPDAVLLYNEYDVSFAGPKSDGLIALMSALKDAGTPVDGVGFQMHLDADFDRYEEVATTFQTMAELDLDIYITELDVSIREGMTEQQQASVYEQVLSLCLEQPRCKAFQAWGFTDMYSWRRQYSPLLFDQRYQPKPAYLALQQRLSEN